MQPELFASRNSLGLFDSPSVSSKDEAAASGGENIKVCIIAQSSASNSLLACACLLPLLSDIIATCTHSAHSIGSCYLRHTGGHQSQARSDHKLRWVTWSSLTALPLHHSKTDPEYCTDADAVSHMTKVLKPTCRQCVHAAAGIQT